MNKLCLSIDEIFDEALKRATATERASFLESACEGNASLRARVEQLLAAQPHIASFLEAPAADPAPTLAQPAELVGTLIGPYKLLEQIGEGGMGLVYMAEQQRPVRRMVALKIIKPGMDSKQVIARFEAERQALALMDHPNIARVLDAGTTEAGRPYFVMELVRGIQINHLCDEKRLTVRQRLELFIQVCQAVQHAHQKGIIHRDLKPTNVLVTMHDSEAVPKVIDFGIAKALGAQLTEHTLHTGYSQLVGTPLYMSPEQAEMNQFGVDTRSDVYSLGVMLYELLTGSTPFDKETLTKAGFDEMRRIIREHEPERPSARLSTLQAQALSTVSERRSTDPRRITTAVRGELDWIVMKALEKDRSHRYESASSLAADIQRYLNDEPVQACPPSITYRLTKVARRYKTAVIAASIVMAAILGSAAFSAHKYFDERAARREAVEQKLVAFQNAKKAENQAVEATRQKTDAVRQRGEAVRQKAEAERQRDAARQNLYYADTRLALVDLDLGNASRAREGVLAHVPDFGETDHRGWEWYYLLGRSNEAEQALYGHRGDARTIDWSPDGKYIASVSYDGSARIWDTKSWRQVRQFDDGRTFKYGVGWSPDAKKLAWGSAGDESVLRIWDREMDKIDVLHGHPGSIWTLAWSHDGKFIATANIRASEDGNIRVWDVEKRESIAQFTTSQNPTTTSWSHDDRLLAASAGECYIWNTASRERVQANITRASRSAAWHPTEHRLAVGDAYGSCIVWDYERRKQLLSWKAHQGEVTTIKWSRDGVRLLSGGVDGTLRVWNANDASQERAIAAHTGATRSAAWEPEDGRIASSGADGIIRIWPERKADRPPVIDTKMPGRGRDLAWDVAGECLFVNSGEKITTFDARSGRPLHELTVKLDGSKRLASFKHLVVHLVATGAQPITKSVPITESGPLARVVPPTQLNKGLDGASGVLSPDRTKIAFITGAYPRTTLAVHDLSSKRTPSCADLILPMGIAWSPDGRMVAVVGRGAHDDDGTNGNAGWLHVIDADSGERRYKVRIGTTSATATAVAWSHDGGRIVVANEHGHCQIRDARTGHGLVSEQIHTSSVHDLAWSPDDRRIASGGINEQVQVWDSTTGQQLLALEPFGTPIDYIRWSPDGRKLAAAGSNGVIKVWDATAGYEMPNRDFWRKLIEPKDWNHYSELIAQQRWSDAASQLEQMIGQETDNPQLYYLVALLRLQLQDEAGYRNVCQRMLAAFRNTEGKREAGQTVQTCSWRPLAVPDYDAAISLARRAVELERGAEQDPRPRSFVLDSLGSILFRAGKYEEARQHLQAANDASEAMRYGSSSARRSYLLAMTLYRLSNANDARMWLDRANAEYEKEIGAKLNSTNWELRLTLKLLKNEATELMTAKSPNQRNSRPERNQKSKPSQASTGADG